MIPALDVLAGRATPPFLAQTTPRDRRGRWVALMAVAGPVAALAMSLLVVLVLIFAGHLGLPLNVIGGELADLPRLLKSSVYIFEVGIGLAAAAAGLLLAARLIFRRPFRSWITVAPRFRWDVLAWGAAAGVIAIMVLNLISVFMPQGAGEAPILDAGEPLTQRLAYVAASSLGFLIAAWAEEVVFRGYLLQQVGAFTRRVWLVLLINGLVFALFHLEFDPGALAARALLGAVFAWATLRLGGLEFGIGAHAAQNLGVALFGEVLLPGSPETTVKLADLGYEVVLAVTIVACVEWLYRRRTLVVPALA
ncbi:CPBP family intramembrane glutamic endopeptidase [Phenylobacterium sp.]|uniref:CPBP family intramembrane glutamic endopeptidase n=1 Tax=Phenylobacterium sp. TaxID=1871053 RepID=UPI002718612F|nr:CPBP family intramembrane glutamic endopeptidase [Phenylobacterium sp.]MDO8378941.1 CPBP family intramembrane metalloprotease [Phenylobacterium sp.]